MRLFLRANSTFARKLLPMKLSPGSSKTAARPEPGAAIRLGEPARIAGEQNRAGLFLVIFMRLLAGLWVIQGLLQWSAIVLPPEPLFDHLSALRGAAVIFFATVNLVAAVWFVAGGAMGRRDLAFECDRANLRCAGFAGVLFDALDRCRFCLDRYLFWFDVAGRSCQRGVL